jgi:hypothetical protein
MTTPEEQTEYVACEKVEIRLDTSAQVSGVGFRGRRSVQEAVRGFCPS